MKSNMPYDLDFFLSETNFALSLYWLSLPEGQIHKKIGVYLLLLYFENSKKNDNFSRFWPFLIKKVLIVALKMI